MPATEGLRKYLFFIIIPAITCAAFFMLREAQGAYYLHPNSDPAYLYLINSVDVATLQPVRHVDNPGTTVQLLGGVVIRAIAFARGADDIEADVFRNPELYLAAINRVLFALIAIAITLLGFSAYRLTKNISLSLLLQCAPFASWLPVKAMLMVSPEPVLVFTCIFFIILLVWAAEKEIHLKQPALAAVLFAIITAFGLAAKLTFIPLIIIPLVIISGFKWKALFLLMTVIIFHIILIPAYKHYDFFLEWTKMMMMNTQQYGQGSPQIIDAGDAFINLLKLMTLEHPFFIALLFSIGLLAFIFADKKRREETGTHPSVRILAGVTLAAIFHTLLVAKNFSPRYFAPSLMLFTTLIYLNIKVTILVNFIRPIKFSRAAALKLILIAAIFLLFLVRHFIGYSPGDTYEEWRNRLGLESHPIMVKESFNDFYLLPIFAILLTAGLIAVIYRNRKYQEKPHRFLTACVLAMATFYHLRHIDIIGIYHRSQKARQESLAVQNLLEKEYPDYVKIYGERSSSAYYALKYGTSTNFTSLNQLEKMNELYPDRKIFFWGLKLGQREFESWTEVVSFSDILKQGDKVILTGDLNNLTPENIRRIESSDNVRLTNVFGGKREAIYLVKAGF